MTEPPKNHILVVDDEQEICRLLADVLAAEGYRVTTAGDATAALRIVYRDAPDLVISDLRMPHADGLSLVRKIRERDNDIVVIMVTGYASLDTSLEGLRAGISDYLTKPLNMEQLLTSVRRGLEMQRLRRENHRLLVELMKANGQLTQALADLKQAQAALLQSGQMASLGMLVAGVAHELNNPIAFIYGNLKHLGDYARNLVAHIATYEAAAAALPDADRRRIADHANSIELPYIREDLEKLLHSCVSGAERAANIVRDLRIFSRSDENERREVNLADEVDAALNILHNRLKRGITVTNDLGNIPTISAYAGQVGQLLLNLLNNAAQAVDPETGRIWISAQRDGGDVVIAVRDNGPGIAPEHLPRVFEPFFTTKPVGQGTGLGLSICYGIVQKHGGAIAVNSKPGNGAVFTVRWPIEPPKKS